MSASLCKARRKGYVFSATRECLVGGSAGMGEEKLSCGGWNDAAESEWRCVCEEERVYLAGPVSLRLVSFRKMLVRVDVMASNKQVRWEGLRSRPMSG